MERLGQKPTNSDFVQDPYSFYERARAAGDFFFWEDYDLPMAASFRAANTIFRDRRFGRETPKEMRKPTPAHLKDFYAVENLSLLELEGADHARLRRLILRAFTSRQIQALAPEISALADAGIDEFPDQPFDLIEGFAKTFPAIVIARLLGVPDNMAMQLVDWSNAMVGMYQARRSHEMEVAANTATREFSTYLTDYIAYRRSRPEDDLLTRLIVAEEEGDKLSVQELIATSILILNAGHEATVHTIGNAVRTLLMENLPKEALAPDFVEGTVEELLRYDPPLHLFTRYVYEPVELFGQTFKRGDQIGCLLGAVNRDPAIWEEPSTFDPTRPIKTNLSFGAGSHFCIGAPLARIELQIFLPLLFARHPNLSLTETPQYANLYHFHGLEKLMVKI